MRRIMKRQIFELFVAIFLINLLALAQANTNSIPFYDGDPNLLMIGNSYTHFNSLVHIVKSLLVEAVPEWNTNFNAQAQSPGGATLARHVEDIQKQDGGRLYTWLVSDPVNWKWVVLQDQSQVPSFHVWDEPGDAFYNSRTGAAYLDDLVEQVGGQTMFYMTWGRRNGDSRNPVYNPDFLTMQANLYTGYMKYVEETSTPDRPTYVAPVGLVFETIYNDLLLQDIIPEETGTMFHGLYSGDGSHPSLAGSYVAGLTIFSSMTGLDPTLIDTIPNGLDEPLARQLQDAVKRTLVYTNDNDMITYPWTSLNSSWGDGTSSEETTTTTVSPTASPTAATDAPTTDTPTIEPTPTPTVAAPSATSTPTNTPSTGAPTETGIPGSVTVRFIYDNYPQDIAWTLLPQQPGGFEIVGPPLYFQKYGDVTTPNFNQTIRFDDLDPNREYALRISDRMADGICCAHGQGSIVLEDNNHFGRSSSNIIKLVQATDMAGYFEAKFSIGQFGQVQLGTRSFDYRPTTWPDLENQLWSPANEEPSWPGLMPSRDTFTVMINVDLDENPSEIAWELFQEKSTGDRIDIASWDGSTAGDAVAGQITATEVQLNRGWYRFRVTDSAGNGLCCDNVSNGHNSTGYVSLTAPLEATQAKGFLWGNGGNFMKEDEIIFRVDKYGYIQWVRFVPDKMARTVAPTAAPGISNEVQRTKGEVNRPNSNNNDTEIDDDSGLLTAPPAEGGINVDATEDSASQPNGMQTDVISSGMVLGGGETLMDHLKPDAASVSDASQRPAGEAPVLGDDSLPDDLDDPNFAESGAASLFKKVEFIVGGIVGAFAMLYLS